ncbi:MAG: hypothetical protein AB8F95_00320 [Bacteroidia bacterium]
MSGTFLHIKESLIKRIQGIDDPGIIRSLAEYFQNLVPNEKDNKLAPYVKPMRKSIDLETLKKEQNFKQIDKTTFFAEIESLQIEESIEELLEAR